MTRRDKAPNNGRAMTHDEIAERLGIARETVVRAEARALVKLREAIERAKNPLIDGVARRPSVDDPSRNEPPMALAARLEFDR